MKFEIIVDALTERGSPKKKRLARGFEKLRVLNLSNNDIFDITPLINVISENLLLHLSIVSLEGNDQILDEKMVELAKVLTERNLGWGKEDTLNLAGMRIRNLQWIVDGLKSKGNTIRNLNLKSNNLKNIDSLLDAMANGSIRLQRLELEGNKGISSEDLAIATKYQIS